MRLLLINPNTSVGVTERLAGAARAYAYADTEIVTVTAARGVPFISNRAEAAVGAQCVLELLTAHAAVCDAAVIAAFGDLGLAAARKVSPVPVFGMAEAALHTACQLGARFAIVSFAPSLGPWMRDVVEGCGLQRRLAGIRVLDGSFASVADVQQEKEALLVELCCRAVREDGADVVVLAGAPLSGLAATIADRVPVPLVDGVGAAVKQAEALTALTLSAHAAGGERGPARSAGG